MFLWDVVGVIGIVFIAVLISAFPPRYLPVPTGVALVTYSRRKVKRVYGWRNGPYRKIIWRKWFIIPRKTQEDISFALQADKKMLQIKVKLSCEIVAQECLKDIAQSVYEFKGWPEWISGMIRGVKRDIEAKLREIRPSSCFSEEDYSLIKEIVGYSFEQPFETMGFSVHGDVDCVDFV